MSVVARVVYATKSGAPAMSPAMTTGTIARAIMIPASGTTRTRHSRGFHQR